MELKESIATPDCGGINHADFSIDAKYALFTCEFNGSLVKIDLVNRKVVGYLKLSKRDVPKAVLPSPDGKSAQICSSTSGMPQDIRIGPTGKVWYVADMEADGVFLVDGDSFTQTGFIPTGIGAHGLYPSRDGTNCTSPIAARRKSTAKSMEKAASRSSISPATRCSRSGRFQAAAAPIWGMSRLTANISGCPADSTTLSIASIPATAKPGKLPSARNRTDWRYGRNRAAIRWGTPGICAEAPTSGEHA